MLILRLSFGYVILALSLILEALLFIAARRGYVLRKEGRDNGWHSLGSVKRHLNVLMAFVAIMMTMIFVIVGGVRLFSLPLTPFYYHVHSPLIEVFVVMLLGASMFNGKRTPRIHNFLTPLVVVFFTAAIITGDMLVVSLFLK